MTRARLARKQNRRLRVEVLEDRRLLDASLLGSALLPDQTALPEPRADAALVVEAQTTAQAQTSVHAQVNEDVKASANAEITGSTLVTATVPVESVSETLVRQATQVVEPLVQAAAEIETPVMEAVSATVEPVIVQTAELIQPVIVTAQPIVQTVAKTAEPVLEATEGIVDPVLQPVISQTIEVVQVTEPLAQPIESVVQVVLEPIAPATQIIRPTITTVEQPVTPLPTETGSALPTPPPVAVPPVDSSGPQEPPPFVPQTGTAVETLPFDDVASRTKVNSLTMEETLRATEKADNLDRGGIVAIEDTTTRDPGIAAPPEEDEAEEEGDMETAPLPQETPPDAALQGADLAAGTTLLSTASLDAALQQFLDGAGDAARSVTRNLTGSSFMPWLVMGVCAGAVLEMRRRQTKAARLATASGSMPTDSIVSWALGLSGSFSDGSLSDEDA